MTLYVLRHGVAEELAPAGDDRARRLTARGRTRMVREARGMRALGLAFDAVLTSPLPRAAETAAIVAEACGGGPPREMAALSTGGTLPQITRALEPFRRHGHVLIVGHEPTLGTLVSLLLTGSAEGMALTLKKGGMVAVDIVERRGSGSGSWRGGLRWMLTPRQLRRLGR
jgi:phosphohistidine phosphatase